MHLMLNFVLHFLFEIENYFKQICEVIKRHRECRLLSAKCDYVHERTEKIAVRGAYIVLCTVRGK